jgi:transposase InsO family protein
MLKLRSIGVRDYPYCQSATVRRSPQGGLPRSRTVYLAVVLDWATRRVLSWRLSITMDAAFCVETLEDALARHGRPEILPLRSAA